MNNLPDIPSNILDQIHKQWLEQSETKTFLFNLNNKLQETRIRAENLSVTVGSDEKTTKEILIVAHTLKTIIEYAYTKESITRAGK